jgi:NAD-dependent dihydropyrimidine dehydrogenase PreA subunit
MTHAITNKCVGELDGACVDVCPVDCIYEGLEKRYINPNECIDCGACLTVCPVSAIFGPKDPQDVIWLDDNRAFFETTLLGRSEPIGDPGGGTSYGAVGVDTPLVTEMRAEA